MMWSMSQGWFGAGIDGVEIKDFETVDPGKLGRLALDALGLFKGDGVYRHAATPAGEGTMIFNW